MIKSTLALLLLAGVACAQSPNQLQSTFVKIPQASTRAAVSERIGLTDVTISYHRPLTFDRKVFGGIVPYGQVWRAGANDNTTIEFSTPVKVEGESLAAGIYGLHMIPTADEWTIIFSKNATSWGSFTYDEKEDALRVKVKPVASEMHDALNYDFDHLKADSATVNLRWEKVDVPFRVSVDLVGTTLDSLHRQLRYTAQYTWEGLNDAASWCLENKVNYDEALRWVNQSIAAEDRFENNETKAKLLRVTGHEDEAAKVQAHALETGTAIQLYLYARAMQREGKVQEAFAQYRINAKKYPDHWLTHVSNARLLSNDKNFDAAAKEMRAAIAGVIDNKPQVAQLEGMLKRLESKDDINK